MKPSLKLYWYSYRMCRCLGTYSSEQGNIKGLWNPFKQQFLWQICETLHILFCTNIYCHKISYENVSNLFLLLLNTPWSHPRSCKRSDTCCFRNLYFYFGHGESTSTASQKSKDLKKVSLLLQDLGWNHSYLNWVIINGELPGK